MEFMKINWLAGRTSNILHNSHVENFTIRNVAVIEFGKRGYLGYHNAATPGSFSLFMALARCGENRRKE